MKSEPKKVLGGLFAFIDQCHLGSHLTDPVAIEAELQDKLRDAFSLQDLEVREGEVASGGEKDLVVEDWILVENKWTSETLEKPFDHAPNAGTQGRRYAIALGARVVIVPLAYVPKAGRVPTKPGSFQVRSVSRDDGRRVEVRVLIPYGAPTPSREKRIP